MARAESIHDAWCHADFLLFDDNETQLEIEAGSATTKTMLPKTSAFGLLFSFRILFSDSVATLDCPPPHPSQSTEYSVLSCSAADAAPPELERTEMWILRCWSMAVLLFQVVGPTGELLIWMTSSRYESQSGA